MVWLGGEQRMQRVDPDALAPSRRLLGQIGEIGEVADAPVALRAHAVELRGQAPEPAEVRGPWQRRGATISCSEPRRAHPRTGMDSR